MTLRTLMWYCILKGLTCSSGTLGPGGACECEKASGWKEGEWNSPSCNQGYCLITQPYEGCKGKQNNHKLGDGTWCYNNERVSKCQVAIGF